MSDDIKIENEDTDIREKIKDLKGQLKKCISEKEEYLAGWQRAKADFINLKKEGEESRAGFAEFVREGFIKDILPVLDGFEMAINDKDWSKLDKNWQNGIKSLHNRLIDFLKNYQTEEIDAVGKKFNPSEHESISEVKISDKNGDGIVAEVVRKGYKVGDKIIRPAQVRVGKYN